MTTNDETAREKRYQLESQLMTIIEAYTGDRLHEDDTYSKLENALVNFIEQHEEQAVLAARLDEDKHLLMTYWDDSNDSIPCADIEKRIAALQQASQKGTQE